MHNTLVFHVKSKVFNNAENPLEARASIQAQTLPTMFGKLKAQLVLCCVCTRFCKLALVQGRSLVLHSSALNQ